MATLCGRLLRNEYMYTGKCSVTTIASANNFELQVVAVNPNMIPAQRHARYEYVRRYSPLELLASPAVDANFEVVSAQYLRDTQYIPCQARRYCGLQLPT